MNKKRIELMKQCRYYKGEEDSPYEALLEHCKAHERQLLEFRHWFWSYERIWIGSHYSSRNYLHDIEEEGRSLGLEKLFPQGKVPFSLLALLYNRHLKEGGDQHSFRDLYKIYLLG